MPNIVVLGEALIDVFADTGVSLRDAKTLRPRPGGAPANVAYALARLACSIDSIDRTDAEAYWAIVRDKDTCWESHPHRPTEERRTVSTRLTSRNPTLLFCIQLVLSP